MMRDPQVDLIFSHFIPRYEATGVDPNDLRGLMPRISQWAELVQNLVRGRSAAKMQVARSITVVTCKKNHRRR